MLQAMNYTSLPAMAQITFDGGPWWRRAGGCTTCARTPWNVGCRWNEIWDIFRISISLIYHVFIFSRTRRLSERMHRSNFAMRLMEIISEQPGADLAMPDDAPSVDEAFKAARIFRTIILKLYNRPKGHCSKVQEWARKKRAQNSGSSRLSGTHQCGPREARCYIYPNLFSFDRPDSSVRYPRMSRKCSQPWAHLPEQTEKVKSWTTNWRFWNELFSDNNTFFAAKTIKNLELWEEHLRENFKTRNLGSENAWC